MNSPAPVQAPEKQPAQLQLGQAVLKGRIRTVRRNRGQRGGFVMLLVLPAADEFTSPAFVEVMSEERIGEPGDDWRGRVNIGGFRRTYKIDQTDRDGEVRQVTVETADVVLTAV